MSTPRIPRRLAAAKPQATLRGDLHALALMIRACAVGAGGVVVCAVGSDVHLISDGRSLAQLVIDQAPQTIIGHYTPRAKPRDILEDLQFVAEQSAKAAA